MEISEREAAALADPQLKASIERGLKQSAAGDVHDLGDFEQYADDDVYTHVQNVMERYAGALDKLADK